MIVTWDNFNIFEEDSLNALCKDSIVSIDLEMTGIQGEEKVL